MHMCAYSALDLLDLVLDYWDMLPGSSWIHADPFLVQLGSESVNSAFAIGENVAHLKTFCPVHRQLLVEGFSDDRRGLCFFLPSG